MKALLQRWLRRGETGGADAFDICLGGNRQARNVLIFTEHVNATYFISFDIPLRRLHAQGRVNFAVVSQQRVKARGAAACENWADAFRPDVVVMSRYGQPHAAEILAFFRRRGIPVIYHIDDDLLDVPESLGTEIRQRQGADSVVAARRHLIGHCDLVYASTVHLAGLLQQRFPAQRIVAGSIYAPYMGDELGPVTRATRRGPVVGYMGSKGHQHDLDLAVPALIRLLEERPEIEFEVFGTIQMPPQLVRFGNRVHSRSVQKSYRDFLATLAELGWDIGLAPLVDASFNRCKAPTKYIEYTAAGIPVIASDIHVYRDVMVGGGGGVLASGDGWHEAITAWLDSPGKRQDALVAARDHCREAFALPVLERQLIGMFQQVERQES